MNIFQKIAVGCLCCVAFTWLCLALGALGAALRWLVKVFTPNPR